MSIDLSKAKGKVTRAKKHQKELTKALKKYLKTEPFVIERRVNSSNGDVEDIVKIKKEIPSDWSNIVGDILHNLRATLDYLITSLVEANGNVSQRSNSFPIYNSLADYKNNSSKNLIGLNVDAKTFIDSLKPYRAGNDLLWRLHKLDIQDKHKKNLLVGAANRSVNLAFKMDFQGQKIKFPVLQLKPADRLFPLEDGGVLFRFNKSQVLDSNDFSDNSYTFEVAFSGDQIFDDTEVINALNELVIYVEKILNDALKL